MEALTKHDHFMVQSGKEGIDSLLVFVRLSYFNRQDNSHFAGRSVLCCPDCLQRRGIWTSSTRSTRYDTCYPGGYFTAIRHIDCG